MSDGMIADDLFVGVTTWNSELLLEHCLKSIQTTTNGIGAKVGVVDNVSRDRSAQIAKDMGANVVVEHCSQSIALNRLLSMSRARHTLLIHADVILLSQRWYDICSRRLAEDVALVSPEDIGCGPLTRPYGAGKPESSFMLFDTVKARHSRTLVWSRRRGIPWPHLRLNLDRDHVTHGLPDTLGRLGYRWCPMRVHASPSDPSCVYTPPFIPEYWSDDLSSLRYAMGNFYSLDGEVTHYHNWYDRASKDVPITSTDTTGGSGHGLPLAYLSQGTRRFLDDFCAGSLSLPRLQEAQRVPLETPRHRPDLARPWKSRSDADTTSTSLDANVAR